MAAGLLFLYGLSIDLALCSQPVIKLVTGGEAPELGASIGGLCDPLLPFFAAGIRRCGFALKPRFLSFRFTRHGNIHRTQLTVPLGTSSLFHLNPRYVVNVWRSALFVPQCRESKVQTTSRRVGSPFRALAPFQRAA